MSIRVLHSTCDTDQVDRVFSRCGVLPLCFRKLTSYSQSFKMGHTKGYRRGTRYMFARQFRHHGPLSLSTYMTTFKVGDIVDIKVGIRALQRYMRPL